VRGHLELVDVNGAGAIGIEKVEGLLDLLDLRVRRANVNVAVGPCAPLVRTARHGNGATAHHTQKRTMYIEVGLVRTFYGGEHGGHLVLCKPVFRHRLNSMLSESLS
jgi:hypothetical protein